MITIEELIEQERLAFQKGDYEKCQLISDLIDARKELQDYQEHYPYHPSKLDEYE